MGEAKCLGRIKGAGRAQTRIVGRMVDAAFNGELQDDDRHIAFVLLAWPFDTDGVADINFISNHKNQDVILRVLKGTAERIDMAVATAKGSA